MTLEQINLRGLDGIQGPVYVGTGCVFNRTALYGTEPPLKLKKKKPGFLSSLCGGSKKKSSKSSKEGSEKKMPKKYVNPTVPVFNLEDIEGVVEGRLAFIALIVPSFKLFSLHLKLSFSTAKKKCSLLSCFFGALHLVLKFCLPNHLHVQFS